eukprot:Skav231126  [mRNA]  locus=scaffold7:223302:224218:+ [translate_table: standard]
MLHLPLLRGWKIRADSSSQYAAVCHDSSDLLLARRGKVHSPQGPILETARLPEPFSRCIVGPKRTSVLPKASA